MKIKHELSQGSVQSCYRTAHESKTGTGNLTCIIKIKLSKVFTKCNVILWFEIKFSWSTDNAYNHIFRFILSYRN